MGDGSLDSRTDEQIQDDVAACLMVVGPFWVRAMDPWEFWGWVGLTLNDLEKDAREHGMASSGCMVVEYDKELGRMQ